MQFLQAEGHDMQWVWGIGLFWLSFVALAEPPPQARQ
jgi:hypothetical protein